MCPLESYINKVERIHSKSHLERQLIGHLMCGHVVIKLRYPHSPHNLVGPHWQSSSYRLKTSFTRSVCISVWTWKVMLNINFFSTFLKKCLQNAIINFGSRSDTITIINPWCLHHALSRNFAIFNSVADSIVNIICAIMSPKWLLIFVLCLEST